MKDSLEHLKIRIEDIPPEGKPFRVAEEYLLGKGPQGPLDTRELGMSVQGKIEADLSLERIGGVIRVRGPVCFDYTMPCARSNEPVPCRFDEPLDVTLRRSQSTVRAQDEDGEEIELTVEDADEWTYEGDELDLLPLLYEHIALNLPLKVVAERFREASEEAWSDPAGKGAEKGKESPFAALAALKLKDSSGN